jgi:HK97 family phage major capsid protein/HK97 family phage prohead protease
MQRAWATLEIKSLDTEHRIIEGIATTPTADRGGDVMAPDGAQFALPMPFLWQHDQRQPIGEVFEAAVTPAGIAIRARIARLDEPGVLQDRLESAWQSIKLKLVRGLSIGWRPIEAVPRPKGGLHVKKWLWAELSAVTIPQNMEATILAVKSADLAAPGRHPSRDRDSLPIVRVKGAPPMEQHTVSEQLTSFEHSRAAKHARMTAIMTKSAEAGATLDQAETEEYDGLDAELKSIDAHLVRLRALEKHTIATATPITAATPAEASLQRSAVPIVQVTSLLPKGTAFTRYCIAKVIGKGSTADAIEFAKRWHDSTPEVELALKAAVAAGTTTDATWAGPLAPLTPLANEFLELLRPATILGKIPGFRRVPFNVSIATQTGGGTYQWVGQGAPKPVGKLAFSATTLGITKCAGIIVITEELAKVSTPSAESVIRQDMINGIAAFLDLEFTDPSKAPVAGVSPGSVTNGVTPVTTAGTSPANARTDIQALANAMTAANVPIGGAVVLMSATNMLALSSALNALGQPLFPSVGVDGGTALGFTFVPSQAMGTTVAMIQPDAILYADDGGVTIDVSREASVQMDSALDNPPLATTVLTSLWQNNLVGLRAERFINWKKARAGSVQYTVATYTA